jgi:oligopeptide/dipeptide ABC transporter ATP-binding protein
MAEPLLAAEGVGRSFQMRRRLPFAPRRLLQAVSGVSLSVAAGETVGLVGESGSGKSTFGRVVAGVLPASAGTVRFRGAPLADPRDRTARRAQARRLQLVFQDTLGALNPRLAIGRQVREVLDIHALHPAAERMDRAAAALAAVGIAPALYGRYPHELSGGQRQRVVIARALIAGPELLVCDEPVSALDVSVQAQVIALLLALRRDHGLACLFISHDLRVVRQVCDRVAVMYLGEVVEQAPRAALYARPLHPYTQALLAAVPVDDPRLRRPRALLSGEPPSPLDPPSGCRFHPRCPRAEARCAVEPPPPRELAPGHVVACHMAQPPC